MGLSPAAILYDSTGTNPLGTDTHPLRTDPTGTTTQPISASSLPLPTGAATESTLAAADTKLGTIDSVLDSIKNTDGVKKITDALPAGTNLLGKVQIRNPGNTADLGDASDPMRVDPTGTTTQPISVASLPLPSGAATETTLAGVKSNQESTVDSGNSSTSQLGNGGTFVGTGVDCIGYSAVAVTVHSDKDSATDGMKFQFSIDNTNWDDSYDWTMDVSSSSTRRFQFPVTARYFRVNYTNSSQATSDFRCQTILHRQNILTSIHRLKDDASADRSAQVVKSVILAQRAGGASTDFIAVEADPGGNLKIAVGESLPAGDNNIGNVDVVSSALPTGAATEATLSAADTKLGTIDSVLDSIKDTDGIKKITDALPIGDNIIGRVKLTDGADVVDIIEDDEDGIKRLQIKGKVSVSAPATPATATSVTIAGDDPLDISTTQNESYTIPDGETFTLTSVSAGAEGDPTEKGSKVEVIYYDGTDEHLISRIYITGQTVSVYPDTSITRDGTSMTGDGSTKTIIVRRLRLSGTSQEVDAVARGYVQ